MKKSYDYNSKFKITSHGVVKLYIGALLASSISAFAAPQSGTVTLGNAAISQSGLSTQITQTTQKAAINWQSFSIANNESVEFKQPNTSAIALNRVIGNEKSIIDGILKANGQVFLINKNGLLFGKDSYVNVGGLVASTLDLQDSDFAKDNFVFKGSGSGKIINLGKIEAKEQGYVVFISSSISNEGVISSKLGKTALLAGDEAKLTVSDGSLVSFEITKGVVDALVENKNAIYADGGEVTLSAKGVDELKKSVVNNTGVIEAKTIGTKEGKIYLLADKGSVKVGGKLDASAPTTGNGGFIETSGDKVEISPTLSVSTKAANGKTGTWLIDPTDYYVASSGGDITGAMLSSQLESNNIIIQSGHTDDEGGRIIPDAIVNIPDNKKIIIDSKVTLLSYMDYCEAESDEARSAAAKALLTSIKKHIDGLAAKRYQDIDGAFEYVFMFIPLEGAYLTAISEDRSLFEYAISKNVALVTASSLMTTLKTVQMIWRYERQNQNAAAIAKEAGAVYDKIAGFLTEFEKINTNLKRASDSYENARKLLATGRGAALARLEKLKDMGAKTQKSIEEYIEFVDIETAENED